MSVQTNGDSEHSGQETWVVQAHPLAKASVFIIESKIQLTKEAAGSFQRAETGLLSPTAIPSETLIHHAFTYRGGKTQSPVSEWAGTTSSSLQLRSDMGFSMWPTGKSPWLSIPFGRRGTEGRAHMVGMGWQKLDLMISEVSSNLSITLSLYDQVFFPKGIIAIEQYKDSLDKVSNSCSLSWFWMRSSEEAWTPWLLLGNIEKLQIVWRAGTSGHNYFP